MSLSFLSLRCWLDADGKHVWQSHECKDGKTVESVLPNPPWHILGKKVEPSINCSVCDLHAFGEVADAS